MNPVPHAMSSVLRRWERAEDCAATCVELLLPAGPLAVCEEPAAEPPVVIFRRAPVVVLLHGS